MSKPIYESEQNLLQQQQYQQYCDTFSFLKGQWNHYKRKPDIPLDDQIDQLNKVVAMIRGRMGKKLKEERFDSQFMKARKAKKEEQWQQEQQIDNESREIVTKQVIQRVQLLQQIDNLKRQLQKIKKEKEELTDQLSIVKQKLKGLEQRYKGNIIKTNDLEDQLERVNRVLEKHKNSVKVLYKGDQFTVNILFEVQSTQTKELCTNRSLKELQQFLEFTSVQNIENKVRTYTTGNPLTKKSSTFVSPSHFKKPIQQNNSTIKLRDFEPRMTEPFNPLQRMTSQKYIKKAALAMSPNPFNTKNRIK